MLVDEPGWAVEYARLTRLGMRLLPVPRGPDGPDLAVMAELLARHRPRLYVTVSVLHNPTGASLTPAAAHQVLRLAEAHDLTIVEDDTYSWLAPMHATRLAQLDALQRTVYVSGFSKILTPQWRVGFVAAAPALAERLIDTKLLTTLTTPALLERAVALCLEQGLLRRHAERVAAAAGRSARALCAPAAERRLPAGERTRRAVWLGGRGRGHRSTGPAAAGRGLAHRTGHAVPCHAGAQHADAGELRHVAGRALLAAAAGLAYICSQLKRFMARSKVSSAGAPVLHLGLTAARARRPRRSSHAVPACFFTPPNLLPNPGPCVSASSSAGSGVAEAETHGQLTRLSALNPSLLQDLLRFRRSSRDTQGLDVLLVMAAALRHGRDLRLHLEHDLQVLPLTVFPLERQVHAPLTQHQLLALPLHQLRVLQVEPAQLRADDEPVSLSPLGLLLWELALRGTRDELLPQIGGQAAYRIAPGHQSGRAGHQRLAGYGRGPPAGATTSTLRTIASWPGFDRERAMRMLNGLYLQARWMVSPHPPGGHRRRLVQPRAERGLSEPSRRAAAVTGQRRPRSCARCSALPSAPGTASALLRWPRGGPAAPARCWGSRL